MSDRIGVMSAGKLLQVGGPREIYNNPVDRFVADFIGETNFLEGEADSGAVRLADGTRVEIAAEKLGGRIGRVTIAVRPEQVRVTETGSGDFPARVTSTVYFGTDTHCHLALADGSEIVARLQSPPDGEAGLSAGTSVGVSFAPGAVQVLDH